MVIPPLLSTYLGKPLYPRGPESSPLQPINLLTLFPFDLRVHDARQIGLGVIRVDFLENVKYKQGKLAVSGKK